MVWRSVILDKYLRFGEICFATAFIFYPESWDYWIKFQMLKGEKI